MSEQRRLQRQMNAATDLIRELHQLTEDVDAELIADSVEGETDLAGAIEQVLNSMDEDAILHDGISARMDDLAARRDRVKRSMASKRAMIEQAMTIGEIPKLVLPAGTVSLGKVAPKVIVLDESLIPARFFEAQPPKLVKKMLNDAMKEWQSSDKNSKVETLEPIPGATFSNGGISLTIRKK